MPSEDAVVASDRVEPILQFSVVCDGLVQDPATNKLAFVGVFEAILRPTAVPQFFVINKWINGVGTFQQTVEILDPDLGPLSPAQTQRIVLLGRNLGALAASGFVNLAFPRPGVYWVQVKLDDELAIAYPLTVMLPQESPPPSTVSSP